MYCNQTTGLWTVMTELYKEQHPLLCEEFSEEERYSPPHHRRRPMSYRNRATYHVKGAAALFRRWPDHWSSFVAYWWIGIGMICLTTFILYNSLFTFSIIPSAKSKPTKSLFPTGPLGNESPKKSLMPEVFMHAFYLPDEEVDLNKYLPYIDDISRKYLNFKYNLIIVINDTLSSTGNKELNAEEVNYMALNTIWSKDVTNPKIEKVRNVNLKYITLSEYMDNSPLIKFWRDLSNEVIEFLLRSLSIWDKGGIVFNPAILIPDTRKEAYRKKIIDILEHYHNTYFIDKSKNVNKLNIKNHFKKRVNNIRDVIETLEHEDSTNYSQETLIEEENKEFNIKTNKTRTIRSMKYKDSVSTNQLNTPDKAINLPQLMYDGKRNATLNDSLKLENSHRYKFNVSNTLGMLPSFLEYLFHGKHYDHQFEETPVLQFDVTTLDGANKIKSNVLTSDVQNKITDTTTTPKVRITDSSNPEATTNEIREEEASPSRLSLNTKGLPAIYNKNRLTIDLKGNIIATKTPCHAFLGSLYSNAVHYPKPVTLTNFLISELSTFCKGLLTTCVGIDLILL
ncbi:hypothetical protein K1T71_007243 [Dendrolimus kikuchii]|uniref:Uncharacterized protein n=1 Tax=Dendrolimus kikuchii TaxID=765133 RepID=A0ACC1D0I8_9NEOP|nr:hypothetical protein K1T71_007243 [Dendrolimus kikuchii]